MLVLLCGLTLAAGFANKYRCAGPGFDERGRSVPDFDERGWLEACYSDIQLLWLGRGMNEHVFPYLSGGITEDGALTGGAVEYPVLTGMLMWAGAAFAETDAGFLIGSAILLAPFGLLVALLLGHLTGWRALWWALGPPLVLYGFHNWDLAAVACAVAAFAAVLGPRWSARPLRQRSAVAAALLGVGFTFKLFPAIFVLPLALYVATGGDARDSENRDESAGADGQSARARRWDLGGALRVLGISAGTAILINLPFAVAGFDGWRASFEFQRQRDVDISTNSVWFWAFRPYSEPDNEAFQSVVSIASPLLVLIAFAIACAAGTRRCLVEGTFPLLGTSAAMLCGFLALHTVHSPQFALWLLPMFVLLRVHAGWIVAYLLADLALGIGIFRYFGALNIEGAASISDGFAAQAVMIGVWGRAALLAGLFIVFLGARSAVRSRRPAALGDASRAPADPARDRAPRLPGRPPPPA